MNGHIYPLMSYLDIVILDLFVALGDLVWDDISYFGGSSILSTGNEI